jgi:protein tyrosine phosphatase (PTP) superfamily phosphohydrolase (DUF442 family)
MDPVIRFLWTFLGLAMLAACTAGGPRTVVSGRLYMSAQPDAAECSRWIRDLALGSVVNLRGVDEDRATFLQERRCTDAAGIERLDLPFLASQDPPRHLVLEFVRRFPALREPVLIHCRSGVDRSALGVFLALMLWDTPFTEAASWVRDFSRHPCPRRCPQKRFVDGFEAWCGGAGRRPDRSALIEYVERDYCPDPFRCRIEPEAVPPAAGPGGPVRFAVRVQNTGTRPWNLTPEAARGVRLGVRLYGPLEGAPADPEAFYYARRGEGWDACRAGMEEGTVRPGEGRRWEAAFNAPSRLGFYLMAVDMVDENRAWFSDLGRPPQLFLLAVGPVP